MNEDKKEKISKLLKQVSELSDDQREAIAQKFGLTNPEGHILSARNQCLLYFRAGDKPLSIVAGFRQWQKSGRIVSKGQRGYLIAVPSKNKTNQEDKGEVEENIYFLYKIVFDISQTEVYNLKEVVKSFGDFCPNKLFLDYLAPSFTHFLPQFFIIQENVNFFNYIFRIS